MTLTTKDPILGMAVVETLATIISCFIALTSILGGILLSTGLENNNLSFDLLKNTPFKDFFIPGILLIIIVGSTSSLSSLGFIINLKSKEYFGLLSGLALTLWILVEILLLNQPHPTIIEIVYLFAGLLLIFLSYYLLNQKKQFLKII